MSQNTQSDPIFLFETSDPSVVTISLSESGKEKIGDDSSNILEDLVDNIDVSLREAGYMYDIIFNQDNKTVDIRPFEGIESFNQEVFDLIAEELQFSDSMVRDNDDEEDDDSEE